MAQPNALPIKYTDENYVTKQGFYREMGTSLLESLWAKIEGYRASFRHTSELRTIPQLCFYVTETEVIKAKIKAFEDKLFAVKGEYEKLLDGTPEKEKVHRAAVLSGLRNIRAVEGFSVSDPTLNAMLSGAYREARESDLPLLAYRDFLRGDICKDFHGVEDFFAELYGYVCGSAELVTFYRLSDAISVNNKPLLGRIYECAPVEDLEGMMKNLESFISHSEFPLLSKALLALYFIDYAKPFVSCNDLLAVALCKKLLSHPAYLGEAAFLLPLETVLLKGDKQKECFEETQKTADFTYVLFHVIETVTPLLDILLNDIVRLKNEAIRKEFVEIPKEESPSSVPPTLTEVSVEEEEGPLEEVLTPSEPPKAIPPKEEPVVEETPALSKKPKPIDEVPVLEVLPLDERSVFAPRANLSDKEVRMAARYIMETHPEINRQQALFFASHSTIGRYYTIQDYKKAMKVAYETARTSMDRLAASKLYKKLRIKNKYVYTPRSPGEKE